jgi:glycosyltransferase involved in cell wall biosynthesis
MGSLNRGGAETLMLDVFNNASQSELDIVGIHKKRGELYSEFNNSGWPLIQVYPRNGFDIGYIFRLRKILKRNRITIVHAQYPLDAFSAIMACWGTSIKVLITFHGFSINRPRWYQLLVKFVTRNTQVNLFVSNTQRDHYLKTYSIPTNKENITIYNSIDLNKFNVTNSNKLRTSLGIAKDHILLGSVGNFNSGRDQLTICKGLKKLNEEGIAFHFVFAGAKQYHQPEYYDQCIEYCRQNKLEKQVHFLGSRNDIPLLIKELDAFVYSSRHDTFGIAVLEAMASGVPIIVNDWKVMLEITKNGHYGIIFRTGDDADLKEKLMIFLDRIDTFKQKATNLKNVISKNYNITEYLRKLKNVYSSMSSHLK